MPTSDELLTESGLAAERLMQPELTTQEVEDVDGELRELFTLPSGDQVVFRGRNDQYYPLADTELPQHVLTTDENGHLEGSPKPPTEQPKLAENNLFVANATPLGVIDLALQLRSPDQPVDDLAVLRKNVNERQFGDKETALLDLMTAALYNSDESYVSGIPKLEGLIDVAAALNGDKAKADMLHEKMKSIESVESKVTITELGDLALEKSIEVDTPISSEIIDKAKGLVLVRATSFEPEISDSGEVKIQSASDYTVDTQFAGPGTRAFIPRETIHFALNHHVESHMFGSFENTPYTVVSPLDKALKASGRPLRMADVDTYYATGPGEKVTLPDSLVVMPGGGQEEIVRRDGDKIFFKDKGFTAADVDKIVQAYIDGEFGPLVRDSGENKTFGEWQIKDKLIAYAESQAMFIDERDSEVVKLAHERGDIPSWRLTEPLDREKAEEMDVHEVAAYLASRKNLDGTDLGYGFALNGVVSALAVDGAIASQGGEVVHGGMHYTSSAKLQERVRDLNDALDVQGGLHSSTAEKQAEDEALSQLYSKEGTTRSTSINHVINDPRLPQRIRRSYIANGLLTASTPKPRVYSSHYDF